MLKSIFVLAMVFLGVNSAQADLELLPDSRHQQFLNFAMFTEDHSTLVWRNANKPWAALGGSMALAEFTDWRWKPQVVFFGSANAAFHMNGKGNTIMTETIDARAGLVFEFQYTEATRFSLGWTHMSGHTSDDVPDRDLIGSNLGNEQIVARLVHDVMETGIGDFRVGGSLKPFIGSEPGLKFFAADQFAEWFPLGSPPDHKKLTPYLSVAIDWMGVERVYPTWQVQLGAYFGNHMRPTHHSTIRFVAGYYQGIDPRLKYAQMRLGRAEFGYVGVMFDI